MIKIKMEIYHQFHCSYQTWYIFLLNHGCKDQDKKIKTWKNTCYLQVESICTFLKHDFHHHTREESCLLFTVESTFLLISFFCSIHSTSKEQQTGCSSNYSSVLRPHLEETWRKGKNAKWSYGQHISKIACYW